MSDAYRGAGIARADRDVERTANALSVESATLQAVLDVEARSRGFYPDGRLVMLFEPHIAYRYEIRSEVRAKLVDAGVAYRKWGAAPYPRSVDARYQQWETCARIAGEELACTAASWGLPQMMGFNHEAAGHRTAVNMVRSFATGEAAQLEGMASFIRANKRMHKALKIRDWPEFARRYNGPAYKANNYHLKLAKAYTQHRGTADIFQTLSIGDKGRAVEEMQCLLIDAGHEVIPDSDFGPMTRQAVIEFQMAADLAPDGVYGPATSQALTTQTEALA